MMVSVACVALSTVVATDATPLVVVVAETVGVPAAASAIETPTLLTGVAAFGLFVELIEHFVEGLVHISTMADDYYRFVERAHMLRGENAQRVYRLGDKVKVQVIRVNMDDRRIDLGLVDILERVREGERGPRRSKTQPKAERPRKRKGRPGRRERAAGRRRK